MNFKTIGTLARSAIAGVAIFSIANLAAAEALPHVKFATSAGDFVVELYPDKAPKTVENFLQYVKDKHYNGTIFHRVINNFMVQGGGFDANYAEKPTRAPVQHEGREALEKGGPRNVTGTLAMARTNDPQSATAQFFINVKDNPALDYRAPDPQGWGYAVFGQVVGSMEVVDKIRQTPTGAGGPGNRFRDVPTMPVIIQSVTVLPATSPATAPAAATEPVKKSSP